MKLSLLILLLLCWPVAVFAQTNTCAGAFCCTTSGCYDGQLVNPPIYFPIQPSTTCAGLPVNKAREWWVSFMPATTGPRVFTFNPDTGPVGLRFYTGTCAGLTQFDCYDYTSGSITTTVNLTAGVTYYIQMTTPTDPGGGNRTVEVDLYQNPGFADAQMSCPTALPLQVLSLGAFWDDNQRAVISAEIEMEANHDYALEREAENGAFEFVTDAVPNAGPQNRIQFIDNHNHGHSTKRYRIRQTDTDGHLEYSPVVELVERPLDYFFRVFPNPTTAYLGIRAASSDFDAQFEVYNTQGQLIHKLQKQCGSLWVWFPTELTPGMYWVRQIASTGEIEYKPVIVQE